MMQTKLNFDINSVNWDRVRIGHLKAELNKLKEENQFLRYSRGSYKGKLKTKEMTHYLILGILIIGCCYIGYKVWTDEYENDYKDWLNNKD